MLLKKMRIKENTEITTMNAPDNYKQTLGVLPKGVFVNNKLSKQSAFIHLFVRNVAELEKYFLKTVDKLKPGGLIWISFPKGDSGIQTDLTRDKGWDCLQQVNMEWLSMISFDETWTAFLMQNSTPKPQQKAAGDYQENQAKYVDAKTKTVIIPDDLKAAFSRNKKVNEIFNALSFTNRKEYVLWIVGAKREETRKERVKNTLLKLVAGMKNPTQK